MGKAAIILVTAVTIASGITYSNMNRAAVDTAITEALYDQGILAREVAKSGFNKLMSRAKADFDNYRVSTTDLAHNEGTMDAAVTGDSGGAVSLTVTGYFDGAEYTISGTLERQGSSLLDALTIDGPLDKIEFKDEETTMISGLDKNPDGSEGSNDDVHAIRTIMADAHAELLDRLPESSYATGIDGDLDVVQGDFEIDIGALVTAIRNYDGAYLDEYTNDAKFDDEDVVIGSAAYPRIVRVNGKVEFKKNTKGYGILYATGDLKFEDTASWEGLVIGSQGDSKFEFKKQSQIHGAVIVSATSEDGVGGDKEGDGGLPGGHFDVDVFDRGDKVYHEHQYDDDFDRTDVDLLEDTANCKSDGALCWDDILTGIGHGWVSFYNEENSSGSYRIKNADMDLTGDPELGLEETYMDLTTMEEFWVDFDALCMLIERSPGDVQSAEDRDGAFSIRIHEDDGGSSGDLLYELSVYHHYKEDYPCAGPGSGGTEEEIGVYGKPMEVKFENDAKIQYSSSALGMALTLIDGFEISEGGVVLTSVAESGVRPKRSVLGARSQ